MGIATQHVRVHRHAAQPETIDPELRALHEARRRLGASEYRDVRNVRCDVENGVLTLRGQVKSFFHKQLALAAVQRLETISMIANELEVA